MKQIINYFRTLPVKEAKKFLVIYYLVGLAGFLIPVTRTIFELLIPVSLLINFFLVLLFHRPYHSKYILFFGGIILFTFSIEAIGVKTGMLFGHYVYGQSIPLKIWETPILIGINWLVLSYGAVEILRSKPALKNYIPVLTGVLMTVFDWVMETVAMNTAMWNWSDGVVPIQNYIMWFVISTMLGAAYELFRIKTETHIAGLLFLLQLLFFTVLKILLP